MISLVLVMFITFMLFYIASKFSRIINKQVTGVISRVIAIILAGLSIQYILDGIKNYLT
jgi:multiple antibiotic resistance protein